MEEAVIYENGKMRVSKPELQALLTFASKDVTRPRLCCVTLPDGLVFSTDGHRALVCETVHPLEHILDAVVLRKVCQFMNSKQELEIRFGTRRAVCKLPDGVFPVRYLDGPPVPVRQVIPQQLKLELFAFDPSYLGELASVCSILGKRLKPIVKLESSEENGPMLFSFPQVKGWRAVVMGCRA